jgi:hypothetical protein
MGNNENYQKTEYEDVKYPTRTILIGLWISLMLLYIYCDIFWFLRPNRINEIIDGFMGHFQINQISLMIVGMLMAIPALMIVANLFINLDVIRWINIIAGILYTFVSIGNIVGEKWAYHLIYGIIEILVTLLIIVKSIKWFRKG